MLQLLLTRVFLRFLLVRKHQKKFPRYKRLSFLATVKKYFGWKSQISTMDFKKEAQNWMKIKIK
jgi:hypothetical protein